MWTSTPWCPWTNYMSKRVCGSIPKAVQAQNRQNPSAEKKWAQSRTHSQKGIHCHYLLGRKDLFFSNGVSHSEDRPYAQIVIDQNKKDPIFSRGWLFCFILFVYFCLILFLFVFDCWLQIFFEREKYQLKGKWGNKKELVGVGREEDKMLKIYCMKKNK